MTAGGEPRGRQDSPVNEGRRFDAIVIGTGIGGLTAGALLARSGQRVLAIERHDRVGGYAHSFKRGPYRFDAAVHLVGGCENGGLIDHLLSAVGVRDRCEFAAVNPCYQAEFPELQNDGPHRPGRVRQYLPGSVPGRRGGHRLIPRSLLDNPRRDATD